MCSLRLTVSLDCYCISIGPTFFSEWKNTRKAYTKRPNLNLLWKLWKFLSNYWDCCYCVHRWHMVEHKLSKITLKKVKKKQQCTRGRSVQILPVYVSICVWHPRIVFPVLSLSFNIFCANISILITFCAVVLSFRSLFLQFWFHFRIVRRNSNNNDKKESSVCLSFSIALKNKMLDHNKLNN